MIINNPVSIDDDCSLTNHLPFLPSFYSTAKEKEAQKQKHKVQLHVFDPSRLSIMVRGETSVPLTMW